MFFNSSLFCSFDNDNCIEFIVHPKCQDDHSKVYTQIEMIYPFIVRKDLLYYPH